METIIQPILDHCRKTPDKIAMQQEGEIRTYKQFMQNVRKVAKGLQEMNITQEKVALLSRNRIEYAEVFLGITYAGYAPLTLDTKWSQMEITEVLQLNQVEVIFGDNRILKNIEHPLLKERISFQSTAENTFYRDWLEGKQMAKEQVFHSLLFIGYTSGTTGVPKGYKRTHVSWIRSFQASVDVFGIGSEDHFIAPGGFAHSLSLFALMQSLYLGATFHILTKFQPRKVKTLCNQYANSVLFLVPTMIDTLLKEEGSLSVKALISSGAQWSHQSKCHAKKRWGQASLYEFYGLSEASYISFTPVQEDTDTQLRQHLFPGVSVEIRNEQGEKLPPEQIGQICVRSDMLFSGYDHQPEATRETLKDGWLLSGDYGYLDSQGGLHLAGRQKNKMITGGLNVYPEEVEKVIKRLRFVKEAMVFGEADSSLGEKIVVVIAWEIGEMLSSHQVRKFCAMYLAAYKVPRKVLTVEKFYYTSGGKIARKTMIDLVEGRNG
ncbi:MAG TPA: AMP-binding protein [Pseudogracilibacillus sp.]|nr:AMP-binding protein [Pseudogracilibacillus sp.]